MFSPINRRRFLERSIASAALLGSTRRARGADASDLKAIQAEIEKHHDESVHRLQDWIRQPSIAAENRGMTEGCDHMMRLLRDAGFTSVTKAPTGGHPGVFATLDAGAARTFGIYFMYDVKQADPAEWSSPPFSAALVDKPGLGKVLIGRGAVNQKGPEATWLAALHAFRAAGRKLPVNLVFVAEGEEEIGSPHFPEVVRRPDILAALRKCSGVYMPMPMQALDGTVTINLGAKGVIELELVSSGERWHRGPKQDLHSSNEARVDSPAWHLVQALATLVGPDGHTPAIEGFADQARPLTTEEKALIREAMKVARPCSAQAQNGLSSGSGDTSVAKRTSTNSASSLSRLMTCPIRFRRTPSLARTSLYSASMSSVTSQVKVAFSIQSRRSEALGFRTSRHNLNPAIPAASTDVSITPLR